MIVNLLRETIFFVNVKNLPRDKTPNATRGLVGRNVLIIGKGNIGNRVGEICKCLKMNVSFFKRGDNLLDKVKNQEVIINCLSANKTSMNLLNSNFFKSLKFGSFFISISDNRVYDKKAMFEALNSGRIIAAAIDDGTMPAGCTDDPFYKKLMAHKKIIATPHIAYNTDYTNRLGNETMINNIEAFLNNKPINLI